jgi:hypothetical protein
MLRRAVVLGALLAVTPLTGCVDYLTGASCLSDADCPGDQCVSGQCEPDDSVRLTPSVAILPPEGGGAIYLTPGADACLVLIATNSGSSATNAPPLGRITSPTAGVTLNGGDAVSFIAAVPAGEAEFDFGSGGGACAVGVEINVATSVAPGSVVELDLELAENGRVVTLSTDLPVMQFLVESGFDTNCWVGSLKNLGTSTENIISVTLTSPTQGVEIGGGTLNFSGSVEPQELVTLVDDQACWTTAPEISYPSSVSYVELDLTLTTASGRVVVLPSGFPTE